MENKENSFYNENLAQKSFGEVFKDVANKYNFNVNYFKNNSIPIGNFYRWSKGDLPSINGLEILISLPIEGREKLELCLAVLSDVNKKYEDLSLKGDRNYALKAENYLQSEKIGEIAKEEWGKIQGAKPKILYTKEFYDPKNSFSKLLNNFFSEKKPKEPCFNEFISYIYKKWNLASPEKLGEILNLKSKDLVREWIKSASQNPPINNKPETQTITDICKSELLNLSNKDEVLLWQISRGKFNLVNEENPLLQREALLFKFQEILITTNRTSQKLNVSTNFLRELSDLCGFTPPYISDKTGISELKVKHMLNDRKLSRFINHYPKEAFKLGNLFFPDDSENAKDCAALIMQREKFINRDSLVDLYLDKKININDLFLFSRIFVKKQNAEDFAKTIEAAGSKTIKAIEDGQAEKPPYEAALKLFSEVLEQNTKVKLTAILKVFKSEIVEKGIVSKASYIDDVLQRKPNTRNILVDAEILR